VFLRITLAAALAAGAAFGADPAAIDRAVSQLRDSAAKAPAHAAIELQIRAAGLLREKHSAAAAEIARASVERLRATPGLALPDEARKFLASLVPAASLSAPSAATPGARPAQLRVPPEVVAAETRIADGIKKMRGLPTDADRARLVLDLTARIRTLPPADKLAEISSLANLSTEGDLGAAALGSVAAVLGEAMRESGLNSVPTSVYLQLASLVRYEHVPAPSANPGLDAASAYLALRERLVEEAGFNLTGLVVLLNFWATWCPPCRKEMPDMQDLYVRFKDKGLIVLGVSDEERDVLEKYVGQRKYTFPILLDPEGKIKDAFNIDGIPQTFIFDRSGKLAAESIDMRTKAQFLKMLKQAGLE
jgi:peroxiredoxin